MNNLDDALNTKEIGNLIDLKLSVNDDGNPEAQSILEQAEKIFTAYKEGLTLPYGDH